MARVVSGKTTPLPQGSLVSSASNRDAVAGVVRVFADQYGGALLDPAAAHDMCVPVSEAFAGALAEAGVEAAVINGVRMGEFMGHRVVEVGHFAVQVGETVYDWTARQFDEGAAVPVVEPVSVWRERWTSLTA